jgi:transglutaminase-like putative cysteine protease
MEARLNRVAVELPRHGWYRVDPRGNGPRIDAQFAPPEERLAHATGLPGEWDSREVFADPLPIVERALRRWRSVAQLAKAWPDLAEPPRAARSA